MKNYVLCANHTVWIAFMILVTQVPAMVLAQHGATPASAPTTPTALPTWVDATKAVAWPVTVLIVLFTLRLPLSNLLSQLGRRISKLTIPHFVELELAEVRGIAATEFLDLGDPDVRGGDVLGASALTNLLDRIRKGGSPEFVIIELGHGQEWLTSRLYIFTMLLNFTQQLRYIAFVDNEHGLYHRFVGIATADSVGVSLSRAYPWLSQAFWTACTYTLGLVPPQQPQEQTDVRVALRENPFRAHEIIEYYASEPPRNGTSPNHHRTAMAQAAIVKSALDDTDRQTEWIYLTNHHKWEHAQWLNAQLLRDLLGGDLKDDFVDISADVKRNDVIKAILRRSGVAFVTAVSRGRFTGLVNRFSMLDRLADRAVEGAQD